MATDPLLLQIAQLKQSLVDEGIMDEKFDELEMLTTNEQPYFAEAAVHLFYEKTSKNVDKLEELIETILTDNTEVDSRLHKLKVLCASVGASKARCEVSMTKEFCDHGNIEGAKVGLERVKTEIETFKTKLHSYFELVKQAKDAK